MQSDHSSQSQPTPGNAASAITGAIKHSLSAADGYLDLKMWDAAEQELSALPPGARQLLPALMMDYRLASCRLDWTRAAAIAVKMRDARPDLSDPWVMLAFAERRATTIESARKILLDARERFPLEAVIWYNLACYECRLGRIPEAEQLLKHACELDVEFLQIAKKDDDLEQLWPALKERES